MAAVNPDGRQQGETIGTLRFADRAKQLRTAVDRRAKGCDIRLGALVQAARPAAEAERTIAQLREQVRQLQSSLLGHSRHFGAAGVDTALFGSVKVEADAKTGVTTLVPEQSPLLLSDGPPPPRCRLNGAAVTAATALRHGDRVAVVDPTGRENVFVFLAGAEAVGRRPPPLPSPVSTWESQPQLQVAAVQHPDVTSHHVAPVLGLDDSMMSFIHFEQLAREEANEIQSRHITAGTVPATSHAAAKLERSAPASVAAINEGTETTDRALTQPPAARPIRHKREKPRAEFGLWWRGFVGIVAALGAAPLPLLLLHVVKKWREDGECPGGDFQCWILQGHASNHSSIISSGGSGGMSWLGVQLPLALAAAALLSLLLLAGRIWIAGESRREIRAATGPPPTRAAPRPATKHRRNNNSGSNGSKRSERRPKLVALAELEPAKSPNVKASKVARLGPLRGVSNRIGGRHGRESAGPAWLQLDTSSAAV